MLLNVIVLMVPVGLPANALSGRATVRLSLFVVVHAPTAVVPALRSTPSTLMTGTTLTAHGSGVSRLGPDFQASSVCWSPAVAPLNDSVIRCRTVSGSDSVSVGARRESAAFFNERVRV